MEMSNALFALERKPRAVVETFRADACAVRAASGRELWGHPGTPESLAHALATLRSGLGAGRASRVCRSGQWQSSGTGSSPRPACPLPASSKPSRPILCDRAAAGKQIVKGGRGAGRLVSRRAGLTGREDLARRTGAKIMTAVGVQSRLPLPGSPACPAGSSISGLRRRHWTAPHA